MPKYIDVEKLQLEPEPVDGVMNGVLFLGNGRAFGKTVRMISEALKSMIDHAPAEDVAPVVHGRWVCSGIGFDCCSECRRVYADGYLSAMGIKPRTTFLYCPNCGAKMDGGKDGGK